MSPVRSKKSGISTDLPKANRTSNRMMDKLKFFVLLLVVSSWLLAVAPSAQAQTNLRPFAGIVTFKIDCDCTNGIQWIFFIPLYLGGPVNIIGPVDYSPFSTTLYGYYNIAQSGLWHLGDYTPGVQSCWKIAGNSCILLPSVGLMSKVGTNRE